MIFLLLLILAGAYSFYIALLIDRPDLAKIVPPDLSPFVHGAFVVLLLWTLWRVTYPEIRTANRKWRYGPTITLRNLIVLCLGLALLLFASREILNGMDPSGHRKLW
jgi:hypothetical protein